MSTAFLSGFTSFGIGGSADIFTLTSLNELPKALDGNPVVLGRGSNVLVSDKGVSGKVVINRLKTVTFDGVKVYAQSGASLIGLATSCFERDLSGLEWAAGIPGSVGGAVVMNAGAFGGCMADVIEYVDVMRGGKLIRLVNADLGFGYRCSCLKPDDFVVGAGLSLVSSDREQIGALMKKFRLIREEKQPTGKSAGSVFKGADKPAGYYIERAGLKGVRVGDAVVSEKHANFIINTGRATAADVLALIELIERTVRDKFGVNLNREIKLIGDF